MPAYRLVSLAGDQRFDLAPGRSVIVGRGVGSDITVYDPTLSRRHAELTAGPDGVMVKDLGSSNGTYVNGRRVTAARLTPNDSITFGKVGYQLEAAPPPPERPSPPAVAAGNTIVRQVAAAGPPPDDASARKLSLLLAVAQKLSGEFDLDRLLDTIAAVSFEVMRVDRVAILLREEGSGELVTQLSRTRLQGLELEHVSASIARKAIEEQVAVLTQNAASDPRFRGKSIQLQNVRSAMCSPLMASADDAVGVLYVDNLTAENAFTDEDLQFLVAFSGLAAVAIQNSRYAEQARREALVRSNFERYFAPDVAAEIIRQKTPIQPGGERRAITVLFADIRGFTAIAERMTPDAIANMLTEYFSEMVDVIFEHGGALDKFIGDALMALWGAPLARESDPRLALQAARAMQQAVDALNTRWKAAGRPAIGVGIGINYGEVFVGNIGSLRRLEYTVIGDAVNVAQRLSGEAGAGEILVSDAFRQASGNAGDAEQQPALGLRGKSRAVEVFRVRREPGAGGSRREQAGAGGSGRE
jgi:adenylate cyclase